MSDSCSYDLTPCVLERGREREGERGEGGRRESDKCQDIIAMCACVMFTCDFRMASLKKSSRRRLVSAGFLSKASLMLPRKRLNKKNDHNKGRGVTMTTNRVNLRTRISGSVTIKYIPSNDASSPPHESNGAVVEFPFVLFGSFPE